MPLNCTSLSQHADIKEIVIRQKKTLPCSYFVPLNCDCLKWALSMSNNERCRFECMLSQEITNHSPIWGKYSYIWGIFACMMYNERGKLSQRGKSIIFDLFTQTIYWYAPPEANLPLHALQTKIKHKVQKIKSAIYKFANSSKSIFLFGTCAN